MGGHFDRFFHRSTASVNESNAGKLRFSRFENFTGKNKTDVVNVIFEDENGLIWFGANRSVSVFNPANQEYKTIEFLDDGKAVPFVECRVIYQIDSNTVLFGGNKILLVKNPWETISKQSQPLVKVASIISELSTIQAFVKYKQDYYWFGTSDGLYALAYKNNGFVAVQAYSVDENAGIKLSHKDIFALHADNQDNIWVGTFGGGLNKLIIDENGLPLGVEYFRKNGILPDDAVYGILQEDDEHLWLSTDMGLCRLHTGENKIDLFDVRDGLINNNFRQQAYWHKRCE